MKKTLIFIIVFISFSKLFACDCDAPFVSDNFMHSDFVAVITIEKVYLNEADNEYYKADISIQELFKGKIVKSINIYGRSDGKTGSSCAIFIPKDTKLIAYSSGSIEELGIGLCSGLSYLKTPENSKWQLNKNALKKSKKELGILRKLKNNNVSLTNKFRIKPYHNLSGKLREIENVKSDKEFGVYKITFNSDFTVASADTVFGFDLKLDKEIISVLENLDWAEANKKNKVGIPDNTEYIIAIQFMKYDGMDEGQLSYYF